MKKKKEKAEKKVKRKLFIPISSDYCFWKSVIDIKAQQGTRKKRFCIIHYSNIFFIFLYKIFFFFFFFYLGFIKMNSKKKKFKFSCENS